jgi:hypothetical protein
MKNGYFYQTQNTPFQKCHYRETIKTTLYKKERSGPENKENQREETNLEQLKENHLKESVGITSRSISSSGHKSIPDNSPAQRNKKLRCHLSLHKGEKQGAREEKGM